jgi:hypothetical protein
MVVVLTGLAPNFNPAPVFSFYYPDTFSFEGCCYIPLNCSPAELSCCYLALLTGAWKYVIHGRASC